MSKAFNETFMVVSTGNHQNAYDVVGSFLDKLESEIRIQADTLIGDDNYLNGQLTILADIRFVRDGEGEEANKI